MANYENLKTAIQQVIYENGNQEITGSVMQATLLAMVNSLGAGYQFIGIATPSTNPGTPDQNVFYLAGTAGTYVNFGNIVLDENEFAILKYNGSWTKEVTGLASAEKVNQLDQKVNGYDEFVQEDYNRSSNIQKFLNSSNLWQNNSNYRTTFVELTPGEKYKVVGYTIFAILKSIPQGTANNQPADFATGETSRHIVGEGVEYIFTAPNDGNYVSLLIRNTSGDLYPKLYSTVFVPGIDGLWEQVAELEADNQKTQAALVGSAEDENGLFVSGYYSKSGKNIGDSLPARSTSSDLMVARVPICKGMKVVCNTQLTVTNTVGHFLIAKENIIVAFPTTAEINAGYVLTDAQIAAGAYQLVVVYRISTQTNPISCISYYNFTALKTLTEQKPLDGKTVILCGDSQLGQAGTFETWIMSALGGKVLNCGFGGARMSCRDAERTGAFDPFSMVEVAETLVDRDFTRMDNSSHAEDTHYPESIANLKSLTNLGNGKDVILTIAYGGNDFSNNVQIGSVEQENVATYLGALSYAVRVLLTAFPRMVILVVGCPYRVYSYTTDPETGVKTITEDSDQRQNNLDLYRYDYNDAAVAGAAALKLPGFDMYHRSGRNRYNAFTLCPNDGTHPTSTAGRRAQGELYVKILTTF